MNDAEVREHVLDEAKKCVLQDRNSTYGKPEDNFRRIAELWTAYLGIRPKDVGAPITPTDVAKMMLLMKVARLAHNPTHKDSWVDLIGYGACGAGIEIGENPKSNPNAGLVESIIAKRHDNQPFKPLWFNKDELRERLKGQTHYADKGTGLIEISLDEAVDRAYARQITTIIPDECQTPSTSSASQS